MDDPRGVVAPDEMTRRSFVTLLGASLALAGLDGCIRRPREKILPYVNQPPELTPDMTLHYATSMVLGGFATGRFTTLDPVLETNDPSQLNGYGYAGNNPVTNSDPTGLRFDMAAVDDVPDPAPPTLSGPIKAHSGDRLLTANGRQFWISPRKADANEVKALDALNQQLKDAGEYSDGKSGGWEYLPVVPDKATRTGDVVKVAFDENGEPIAASDYDTVTMTEGATSNSVIMRLKGKAGQLGKTRQADNGTVDLDKTDLDPKEVAEELANSGLDMDNVEIIKGNSLTKVDIRTGAVSTRPIVTPQPEPAKGGKVGGGNDDNGGDCACGGRPGGVKLGGGTGDEDDGELFDPTDIIPW